MISRIDLRGRAPASLSRTELAGVLPRAATDVEAAVARVRPICDDVRSRGAEAVREYTARFDGVDLATTRVPRQALEAALAGLDPDVRAALEEAARRRLELAKREPRVTKLDVYLADPVRLIADEFILEHGQPYSEVMQAFQERFFRAVFRRRPDGRQ